MLGSPEGTTLTPLQQHDRKLTLVSIGHGFTYFALWQMLVFLVLILLVWVNERLDIAHIIFGAPLRPPDVTRGCLATAGILLGCVITVGNTYLQQRRIVSGLLTICSYCHKIKLNTSLWERIEEYIGRHSEALFSHGVCPDCFKKVKEEWEAETPGSESVPAG